MVATNIKRAKASEEIKRLESITIVASIGTLKNAKTSDLFTKIWAYRTFSLSLSFLTLIYVRKIHALNNDLPSL